MRAPRWRCIGRRSLSMQNLWCVDRGRQHIRIVDVRALQAYRSSYAEFHDETERNGDITTRRRFLWEFLRSHLELPLVMLEFIRATYEVSFSFIWTHRDLLHAECPIERVSHSLWIDDVENSPRTRVSFSLRKTVHLEQLITQLSMLT